MSFYSRVTNIVQERDGWVDCVYLDLKKAFDKVPHARLLWKLENRGGLKGEMLNWMLRFTPPDKVGGGAFTPLHLSISKLSYICGA